LSIVFSVDINHSAVPGNSLRLRANRTADSMRASAWAGANLGFDLMQQARPFAVDFSEMKIEFPSRRDSSAR
jgi:hypothetical protein